MRKKRILYLGESPILATGYSTYCKHVLTYLASTGKYELAQLAAYAEEDNPEIANYPWRIYPNVPNQGDKAARDQHNSNPHYQFGSWRWDDTCIDFKPDIVFNISDIWMATAAYESVFRDFYHLVLMPPCDSAPQEKQWLSVFANCDGVACYTDFGTETLKNQSCGKINLIGSFPPGTDVETFKPMPNRVQLKQSLGFADDTIIIGTTMRNQKRKLIPDLINTFKKLLEYCRENNPALENKLYLYLHISYPDAGWRLPLLFAESGIGHRIMTTYFCRQCKAVFPCVFQDVRTFCLNCRQPTAVMTSTMHGLSTPELAKIYNLFDVYVQYFNREGFGMPITEAAACGVHVMAVDYAGPSDIVRKIKGTPIQVKEFVREAELHAFAAVPDHNDLLQKLVKFITLPQGIRLKKGFDSRQACLKHYTWERTGKLWEAYFDSVPIKDHSQTWHSPPRFHNPPKEVPNNLRLSDTVRWGMANVLGLPNQEDSYTSLQYQRDLNFAGRVEGWGGVQFDDASFLGQRPKFHDYNPNMMFTEMYQRREQMNYWEHRRVNWEQIPKPLFIQIANSMGK